MLKQLPNEKRVCNSIIAELYPNYTSITEVSSHYRNTFGSFYIFYVKVKNDSTKFVRVIIDEKLYMEHHRFSKETIEYEFEREGPDVVDIKITDYKTLGSIILDSL